MKYLLTFFCSMVLCFISLIEAKIKNCEPPYKVADKQKFKFTPCENNADDPCKVQYEQFSAKSVFKFTAPEGQGYIEDDFECRFTLHTKQKDDSQTLSCQIGEQQNIDEKYFEPKIKPIEGGETRFIACYCGEHKTFKKNEERWIETELLVNEKRKYCYLLDAIFSEEQDITY